MSMSPYIVGIGTIYAFHANRPVQITKIFKRVLRVHINYIYADVANTCFGFSAPKKVR